MTHDIHIELAAQMLHLPYEETLRRFRVKDVAVVEARGIAKKLNYMHFMGLQFRGLSVSKLPEAQQDVARQLLAKWHRDHSLKD